MLLTACWPKPNSNPQAASSPCVITPPETNESDRKNVRELALDLSTFVKAPVTVSFKSDLSEKYNTTFQKVNDVNARCQVLAQLSACYAYKNEFKAQSSVIDLLGKACT